MKLSAMDLRAGASVVIGLSEYARMEEVRVRMVAPFFVILHNLPFLGLSASLQGIVQEVKVVSL